MTNPPDTSVTERVARAIAETRDSVASKARIDDYLDPATIEAAARAAIAAISSMPAEENAILRALVARAEKFANMAPLADWKEDRAAMVAVHLAGDCRAALSPRKEDPLKEGASREG